MRHVLCIVGGLLASCSAHVPPRHYVDVINSGSDAIVALHAAAPGSNAWQRMPLHGVFPSSLVEGGYLGRAWLAMPAEPRCRYDLLIEFAQRRALLIRNADLCQLHRLDVERAWRLADFAAP